MASAFGRLRSVFVAAVRVFELVVYQLSVLTVDPFAKGRDRLIGYRRSLILFFLNYVEAIFWFAGFYALLWRTGKLSVASTSPSVTILREEHSLYGCKFGRGICQSTLARLGSFNHPRGGRSLYEPRHNGTHAFLNPAAGYGRPSGAAA
jgi:hypothetical protein